MAEFDASVARIGQHVAVVVFDTNSPVACPKIRFAADAFECGFACQGKDLDALLQ